MELCIVLPVKPTEKMSKLSIRASERFVSSKDAEQSCKQQQNNVRNGRPAENIACCIRKSVEVIVDSRFALLFWESNRPRQDLMKVVQNACSLLRIEAESDSRSLNLQARWVSSLEQQTQKENDGEAILLVFAWHSMTL